MWNVICMVLAVLVLFCMWVILYDGNRFVVRGHVFADARIRKNCRAVVLADLHNKQYGRDNERLLAAIRELEPDMILVAGDMLNARPEAPLETALRLMGELARDYPVYYANGNHEQRLALYPDVYGDMAARYEEGLAQAGIRPLVNAHAQLAEYGITIYGAQIDRIYYKRFRECLMEEGYLRSVLGPVDKSSYSILLAHNPDYFAQYAAWGADLTLAGHIHGGMIQIPFLNRGVASPKLRFFPKYDGGRFERDGRIMLVSRGLGMHTLPIRMFNPGELLVLDFTNESSS